MLTPRESSLSIKHSVLGQMAIVWQKAVQQTLTTIAGGNEVVADFRKLKSMHTDNIKDGINLKDKYNESIVDVVGRIRDKVGEGLRYKIARVLFYK